MGTYNEIYYELECPRCKVKSKQYIQLHFGDTRNLTKLNIGDQYPWIENKSVKNGGRPENGDIDGEGYIECSACKQDFFVKAIVRNNILKEIHVDYEKQPYIE
jgi:hypothetical protein